MLTLTENASTIVTTIVDKQTESQTAGLRISGPTDGTFAIEAVPDGAPGDILVESGDAKVYLEESASVVLDDKVLDAQVDQSGTVEFQLAQQG